MSCKLKKWSIIRNDECSLCKKPCDVNHLLVECDIAKYTWQLAGKILDIKRSVPAIILGLNQDNSTNHIVSVLSYIQYKYWLLASKKRWTYSIPRYRIFLEQELKWRQMTYKYMGKTEMELLVRKIMEKM